MYSSGENTPGAGSEDVGGVGRRCGVGRVGREGVVGRAGRGGPSLGHRQPRTGCAHKGAKTQARARSKQGSERDDGSEALSFATCGHGRSAATDRAVADGRRGGRHADAIERSLSPLQIKDADLSLLSNSQVRIRTQYRTLVG